VKDAWNEAQVYINNHVNRLWLDPNLLPSGDQKIFSWLMLMRINLWDGVSLKKAIAAVKKLFSNNKQKFNQKDADTKAAIMAKTRLEQFDHEYYHPSWLSFLYLGLPCSHMVTDAVICESLKSGQATRQMNYHAAVANQQTPKKRKPKAAEAPDRNNLQLTVLMPRNKNLERQTKAMSNQLMMSNKTNIRGHISHTQFQIWEMELKIHDDKLPEPVRIGAGIFKSQLLKTLQGYEVDLRNIEDE